METGHGRIAKQKREAARPKKDEEKDEEKEKEKEKEQKRCNYRTQPYRSTTQPANSSSNFAYRWHCSNFYKLQHISHITAAYLPAPVLSIPSKKKKKKPSISLPN